MFRIKLCSLLMSLLSCSVLSPGFNETNRNYTLVLIAKNKSGDSVVVQAPDMIDTLGINRIFVYTSSYEWTESGSDDDYTSMTSNAISALTYDVYVKIKNAAGLFDSSKQTLTIKPTYKKGDKIPASVMEEIEISIE